MKDYQAPVADMRFWLEKVFDTAADWQTQGSDLDMDGAVSALGEMARVLQDNWAPINQSGDIQGCRLADGKVHTPDGFAQAYRQYGKNGWLALSGDTRYGGHGLPQVLEVLGNEMMFSANSALAVYAIISVGGAHNILANAAQELRKQYLPDLYAGNITCTMCLTEPHCGSDLGSLITRAEQDQNGMWRINGNKIFISGGEHDMTDNIVHLVLARAPDAPEGVGGISLFLVPKHLPDAPDSENGVVCSSIEHKMGIRGSATCVLNFEDARGWLLGEANRGLALMFTLMNQARLAIGVQGLGAAEMSHQIALRYSQEREQGRTATGDHGIIGHPDVRRMLLTQRAWIQASRGLATLMGKLLDRQYHSPDEQEREHALSVSALLTPIAKAFITDRGMECCVLGQQVLGGHGYLHEWGLEQLVRDTRISQIYEGTNGIQALDFINRKVLHDGGRDLNNFAQTMLASQGPYDGALKTEVERLERITKHLVQSSQSSEHLASSVAYDYMELAGLVVFAWLWQLAAAQAQTDADTPDNAERLATARFYYQKLLPRTLTLEQSIMAGEEVLLDQRAFATS